MTDDERWDGFKTPPPGGGRWTCEACPVQAEGKLPDGRMWYFRGRDGWRFDVSPGPTDDVGDAIWHTRFEGDTQSYAGWMSAAEASAIIADCLAKLEDTHG